MTDPSSSYHYKIIRRAIEAIDAAGGTPLSLDALSRETGLSTAHLQRTFSAHVGVSPKRYQQYLALDHAKALLAQNFTTLDTAAELGLSGTGRLHDLFLTWEAMSPGAYARRGAGLTIRFGWFDSPFGPALLMGTSKGICGLAFAAETGREAAMEDMTARWPEATFTEDPAALAAWADRAFGSRPAIGTTSGKGEDPAPLHLIGAPFQIKVWEALLHIPPGAVTTYSEIAQAIGAPRAVRAVGTAVGRNPVSWLIPCHRALRKTGGLGGYHWGLPVKRAMLAHETAQRAAADGARGTAPA